MSGGWKPRAVSFSSGGVKSIGQMGAAVRLMEAGLLDDVKHWYGCSGGAIVAAVCALGASAQWIREAAEHFDLRPTFEVTEESVCNFTQNWGVASSETYRDYMGRFADAWEPGSSKWTFADLARERPGVGLTIIGTNISKRRQAVFSIETTPNMPIMEAIRISGTIPLVFVPWRDETGDIYVDGAFLEYYPWRTISNKDETLVIVCDETGINGRHSAAKEEPITSLSDYLQRVFSVANKHGILYPDAPRFWIALNNQAISSVDFGMPKETRQALFHGGEVAAARWLSFRQQRHSAGEMPSSPLPCGDQSTSSSDLTSPNRRLDSHRSGIPQRPGAPSRDSPHGHRRRRWSC
jgi:predicted acylesterase/phospholipase RssA